jgi:dihydroflavonol-4-reductase
MILVTGGTGLLGSHLLFELVSSGKKVRALRRESSSGELVEKVFGYYSPKAAELLAGIEWVTGDVTDIYSLYEAMEGVDRVYHAAAVVSFDPWEHDEMMRVNVEGTANVVNACIYKGVGKICHVSSIACLGQTENDELINEEKKWKNSNKSSAYAISKFGAEREVWRGTIEGLQAVIVNPGIIIGPGDWKKGSCRLFELVWEGLRYYTMGVNGYVDVRDVVKAMITLMDSETSNSRFVVTSENLTYLQFVQMVAEGLGKKMPSVKAGALLREVAWRAEKIRALFSGKKPLITKETARTASKKSYYSNEKIRNNFGFEFKPMKVSIEGTCGRFLKEKLDVTPNP